MTLFSFIYQKKVRDLFWQVLVLGLTLGLLVFFILNASRNMREAGIASGFDFLWRTAGIEIPFVLTSYTPQSDNLALLWVGIVNTLLITLISPSTIKLWAKRWLSPCYSSRSIVTALPLPSSGGARDGFRRGRCSVSSSRA